MAFINCEVNLILTWSKDCVIFEGDGVTISTKCYVSFVTLSPQNNAELLQQLKSGFKRTTNWNKYQSKASIEKRN